MSTKCRCRLKKDITTDVIEAIIPNPTQGLVDLPKSRCEVNVQFEDDCSVPDEVTVTLVATNISPNSTSVVSVQDAYDTWADTNEAVLTFDNKCIDDSTTNSVFYQAVSIANTLEGNGLHSITISSPFFNWNAADRQEMYDFVNSCLWFFCIGGYDNLLNYVTKHFYMKAVSNLNVTTNAITFDYNPNTNNTDACNANEYNDSQIFVQNAANFPFNFKHIEEFICLDKYTQIKSSRAKFRVIKCDDTIEYYEVSVTDWANPCPTTRTFLGAFTN